MYGQLYAVLLITTGRGTCSYVNDKYTNSTSCTGRQHMVGKSRVGATNAPVIENVSITMKRVNVIIICTVVGGNL